ncbi:IclR family transcriptional regulator C-terminal domain-containing protein [Lysinibacillus sp. NPDC093210]|uniref:IclR family transcriptional regulator domain-containing protein n=1 Tax=Lysinibacillus sp. NPDC093210 TaxID=3364133 RepID=UPI0038287037
MFVGDTSPLYAGASSKTLFAFMPNVEDYVEHLTFEPITDRTICSKEQLLNDLQQIRVQRFTKSNSERVRGARSVSAPILNASRQIISSVTLVIPEAITIITKKIN